MNRSVTRRQLIHRGIGFGMGMGASAFAKLLTPAVAVDTAPGIPAWPTEFRQLAPNVFAYVQAGGPSLPYAGLSNAGVLAGEHHLTAVDSLAAPLQTQALLAAAGAAIPGKSFDRLIFTHHHGDHIDGAQYFAPVEIVATEFCRKTIASMAPLPPWEKRDGWAVGGEPHTRLLPSTILERKLTYYSGTSVYQVIAVGRAHTWGDAVVYLPGQKVLFAGDVAFFYVAPYAHWAFVAKWIETIDTLLDMDIDIVVPGHGPIGGKRELAETRDYLVLFTREARKCFDAAMSPGRAAATISLGRFDSWRGARDRLPMNTVRIYHEFSGSLTPEMDVQGTIAATKEFTTITGITPQ